MWVDENRLGNSGVDSVTLQTHPVFEVGDVDIPAQCDKVHVHYTEFGREEVEVDHLSWRPNTPVSLQKRTDYKAEKHRCVDGKSEFTQEMRLNINL